LPALLAAALLAGCAVTQPNGIPERMLTPEAVQEAARQDANGEPYYLSYQVGETGLAAAFDDGSHTYVEFERPVPSDLSCFDNAGALLGCEAVGNVLAVEGTHAGILLRQGENASFIAPNPKALTPPPRQLGNTSAWAAHVQARNRVLLKAPLRQALERSAGVQADPNLNQAAGLRASMVQTVAPAQPGAAQTPTSAADRPGTRLLRHGETPSHRETASHHAHATTNEPGPRARGSLKAERPDGAALAAQGREHRVHLLVVLEVKVGGVAQVQEGGLRAVEHEKDPGVSRHELGRGQGSAHRAWGQVGQRRGPGAPASTCHSPTVA